MSKDNKTILVIMAAVIILMVLPAQSAEITGFIRAGNAFTSGYNPCIMLDDNCIYQALQPDGTFRIYAPEGDHVIGLAGELEGFQEYCFVRVKEGVADHGCTFEGNGLATPTVHHYPDLTPVPTPTVSGCWYSGCSQDAVDIDRSGGCGCGAPTPETTVTVTPTSTEPPTGSPTPVPTVSPTPTPQICIPVGTTYQFDNDNDAVTLTSPT